jgi:hypothetical protein
MGASGRAALEGHFVGFAAGSRRCARAAARTAAARRRDDDRRAAPVAWAQAAERSAALRVQADHVRAFLESDDERVLLDAAYFEIPVPQAYAASLVRSLRQAEFVSILSFELRGLESGPRGPLTVVSEALLARGTWVAALGVLVLGSAALRAIVRRGPKPQGEAR